MPALPRLVEYLMSITRGDKGHLVGLGILQTFVPAVPPGVTVPYQVNPYEGEYASIEYYWQPDPSMVPNVWNFSTQQAGNFIINGVLDSAGLRDGGPVWVVITTQQPVRTTITNLSSVYQFWRNQDYYLKVQTPEDWMLVQNALAQLTTRPIETSLAAEANVLQQAIQRALTPQPRKGPPPW